MKGLRIQKSIGLGKFMRLNISKSGVGVSARLAGFTIGAGPRGPYINFDLPGTGLSYRKHLGGKKKEAPNRQETKAAAHSAAAPEIPKPSFLASGHEKDLAKGVENYQAGRIDEALNYFLEAAPKEPGAAIFAAAILAEKDQKDYRAIELLERVAQSDDEFPTRLMEKYLNQATIAVGITPNITAQVPVDGLAATLLLVELYQAQRRIREAIALLEEVESLAGEPLLTLSLCDLYASRNLWDEVIERAQNIEPDDDITTEIVLYYGRAMQEKGLHEAAVTVFSKVLRRKKDRNPDLLHEAGYWRAISYQAQGKAAKANQELQKIFAENPGFKDVAQRLQSFTSS
jgi:tetratricopeptide (TPR) repeat protein